jgi:hypothetical protein
LLILLGLVLGNDALRLYRGFGRRVWDWLNLGGVSLAIALVGWLFTREHRAREAHVTLEETQDDALAAYLDQMSNLMIDHRLSLRPKEDKDGDLQPSVYKVAQARTLAVLLMMDAEHKRGLGLQLRPRVRCFCHGSRFCNGANFCAAATGSGPDLAAARGAALAPPREEQTSAGSRGPRGPAPPPRKAAAPPR